MAAKKKQVFDQKKGVRKLARERIGSVKPAQPIEPKSRKEPKHKKPIDPETLEE